MTKSLVFISFLACCAHAQLIYPDQYEMMRTSISPGPFSTTSTNRQSKWQPTFSKSRAESASPSINVSQPQPLRPQSAPQLGAAASSVQAFQQTYSTVPAPPRVNSMYDWGSHVNNIIVKGLMKFALDVEKEIYRTRSAVAPGQRDNVIFSPLSLAVTLAMVLLGSAGRTFDEVSKVLGLEAGVDISRHSEVVHQMFGMLITQIHQRLANTPGPRVDFASAIFVQDGYSIRPEFKGISENIYKSEVINLDFYRKGKEAQDEINDWVKKKTMEKITSILSNVPRPETNVILISALYFNGEWNQHFLPGATKRKQFFIEENEVVDVDLMYNGGTFPFYEDKQLGAKILGLPYKGFEMSMYILLPTAKGARALRNFENQLTVETIESLISHMKNETCIIGMPRMKLSSTQSMSSTLQSLGLSSLFNPATADLSLVSQGYGIAQTMTKLNPSFPTMPTIPTIPTVSPLPMPYARPGKTNTSPSQLSSNNDLFIFPRFGEDSLDQTRKNYFTYEDKIRGLTVQQWSTGFSIERIRSIRDVETSNPLSGEESRENDAMSYVVDSELPGTDNPKVVRLEENKYRFEKKGRVARKKRQSRPINEDFLNYIKSLNFPSFGLDDLRNSGNLINPHLYAEDVLHKVEIDITERGTEAAAVTAVILERDGNQKRLIANRPFIFFIRHNPSRLLLFWGTLNTPTPNYVAT